MVTKNDIFKFCSINDVPSEVKHLMSDCILMQDSLENIYNKIDELKINNIEYEKITNDSLPRHYNKYDWEPIHFIIEFNLNFSEGCILKYLLRFNDKGGKADLEKVKFYSCCVKTGNFIHYQRYLDAKNSNG